VQMLVEEDVRTSRHSTAMRRLDELPVTDIGVEGCVARARSVEPSPAAMTATARVKMGSSWRERPVVHRLQLGLPQHRARTSLTRSLSPSMQWPPPSRALAMTPHYNRPVGTDWPSCRTGAGTVPVEIGHMPEATLSMEQRVARMVSASRDGKTKTDAPLVNVRGASVVRPPSRCTPRR